jgi:minor extracellular serine protease Vpr
MKQTILLTFLLILFLPATFGQNNHKKMSPYTAVQWSMLKKNPLRASHEGYLNAFVKLKEESGIDLLKEKGCRIGSQTGRIVTARIPYNVLEEVAADSLVEYIDAAREMSTTLDSVVAASHIQPIYDGRYLPQAFTGKGVVVGAVDIGFDYTHPNFYDATGKNFRIKSVWEQDSDKTTSDSSIIKLINYGTEYTTQKEILEARCSVDTTQLHGTHTVGIAAGSGFTTPYRGIAYESEIDLVSTDLYNDHVTDGVNYLMKQARFQSKPCVINISLGMRLGPHDGTTLEEQSFNKISGAGKIIVVAAGNDRYYQNHVFKPDSVNTLSTILTRTSATDSILEMDTWSVGALPEDSFTLKITLMEKDSIGRFLTTTTLLPYSSTSTSDIDTTLINTDGSRKYGINLYAERNQYNSRYNIYASILFPQTMCRSNTSLNDDDLFLVSITGKNVAAHAYCSVNDKFENLDNDKLAKPVEEGCIDSPGTASRVVTVGAYMAKKSYTNLHGDFISRNGNVGDIASFSSIGPTVDGRIKPDITAPGVNVVSSFNSFCTEDFHTQTVMNQTFQNRQYAWGAMSGTSMASPVVAGIIALWLEADPTLTPERIKEVLSRTAKQNSGETYPNNAWGYGKIDAYAGLLDILNLTSNERIDKFMPKSATITTRNDAVLIRFSEVPTSAIRVNVYGLDGKQIASSGQKKLASTELTLFLNHPKGIYAVQVESSDQAVRGSSLVRF